MKNLRLASASLTPIPPAVARAYREKMATMQNQVDREMVDYSAVEGLNGFKSQEILYEQNRYHAGFMATVLQFNAFELLAGTLAWAYQAYYAHGFSYDCFIHEIKAWMRAVSQHLEADSAQGVNTIYQWWLCHHEALIAASQGDLAVPLALDASLQAERQAFLSELLQGETRECLRLADGIVTSPETLAVFYLQVIQPCLYQLGNLWQRGVISAAQEHLASAVVSRVMAGAYARVEAINPLKGKAVVTMAPHDFHELGARMLADCLSTDGWEVDYLGANMPQSDLLGFLAGVSPFLVAISVALPCNLMALEAIVQEIRKHPDLRNTRIMVGGGLFLAYPDLWRGTGADGWAPDAEAAVTLARQWWAAP